jgi:hypothetical protein
MEESEAAGWGCCAKVSEVWPLGAADWPPDTRLTQRPPFWFWVACLLGKSAFDLCSKVVCVWFQHFQWRQHFHFLLFWRTSRADLLLGPELVFVFVAQLEVVTWQLEAQFLDLKFQHKGLRWWYYILGSCVFHWFKLSRHEYSRSTLAKNCMP